MGVHRPASVQPSDTLQGMISASPGWSFLLCKAEFMSFPVSVHPLSLISCSVIYKHRFVYSVVSDSLRLHGRSPAKLFRPWDSLGKNTGVCGHFLLQGIFLTQGLNLCLLHWQVGSLLLSHLGLYKPFSLEQEASLRGSGSVPPY